MGKENAEESAVISTQISNKWSAFSTFGSILKNKISIRLLVAVIRQLYDMEMISVGGVCKN